MTLSIKERQEKAYKLDNYKVIDLDNKKSNICYVFCSSNGLYTSYGDDAVLDNYKFDWENISKNKKVLKHAKRYIFLRDIFCHSYVDGINPKVDSIDKIIDLIKDLTKGYEVYTVGSSGGGYLAMILACKLPNCTRAYSFGGLFNLRLWHGDHSNFSFENLEFYTKYLGTEREKYFDIKELAKTSSNKIVYTYGELHKEDAMQADYIKDCGICAIPFYNAKHRGGLLPFDYIHLISLNDKKFSKVLVTKKKDKMSPKDFSIRYFGLCHYLCGQIGRVFRHLKRKSGK